MIVSELKLGPFAGLTDEKVAFKKGLNVIVGPNEAGKSTIVKALNLVLFRPTQYNKRTFDHDIKPFVPLGGGDTIHVKLSFKSDNKVYHLEKSWGSTKESRLTLPGGVLVTDPFVVQDKIQELLPITEGTFNSVLCAHQSAVGDPLDSLSEDSELKEGLSSILRRAIFETDGVSVERLGQIIKEQYDAYLDHWDLDLDRPERSRGIENPWEKKVGKVLSEYYQKERSKRELGDVAEYERVLDQLNEQIQDILEVVTPLEAYMKENKGIVEDTKARMILEAESKAFREEEKRLHDISLKWPALAQTLIDKQKSTDAIEKRLKPLAEELCNAETHESNKLRIDKRLRAKKKREEWEEAQKVLAGMKAIEDSDFQSLENLSSELTRLGTSLEAGRISLNMMASKPIDIRVTRDLEEETPYSLTAGESLELSAGGHIRIDHKDWTLRVKSGEVDFEGLSISFNQTRQEYDGLLTRLAVADFAEGKTSCELYQAQIKVVDSLWNQFEEILDGEAYEDLEAVAKSIHQAQVPRKASTIGKEQGQLETEIEQVRCDIESATQQLEEWAKEYKSQDSLLDLLVDKRAAVKNGDKKLEKLNPLPKTVNDPAEFINDFNDKQEALNVHEGELSELRIQRAGLQGQAPEATLEEVETLCGEAESHFQKTKREAGAIAEIMDAYEQIRDDMDRQTMDPWLEGLQAILSPLTAYRYGEFIMTDEEPCKIVRADGLEVPFSALSRGTEVGLGLAVRLSMARYFLQDLEGFLVLDDPLVDMDPERQRAAAGVIQGFAEEKQVIVVTCHPVHADLLGGNVIPLGTTT